MYCRLLSHFQQIMMIINDEIVIVILDRFSQKSHESCELHIAKITRRGDKSQCAR